MSARDKDLIKAISGIFSLLAGVVTLYLTCFLVTHEEVTQGYSFSGSSVGIGGILWLIPVALMVLGLGLLISLAAPFDGIAVPESVGELPGGPTEAA